MEPDTLTTILSAAGALLVGAPAAAVLFGRRCSAHDRKFLAETPLQDLWKRTELSAEEQAQSTLLSLSPGPNVFGTKWLVSQDGKDAGWFAGGILQGQQFHCDFFQSSFWTGRVVKVGLKLTYQLHMHDGQSLVLTWFQPTKTFGLEAGEDSYEFVTGRKHGYILRNGQRVGAYFTAPVYARAVAIDKGVPDHIRALICGLVAN